MPPPRSQMCITGVFLIVTLSLAQCSRERRRDSGQPVSAPIALQHGGENAPAKFTPREKSRPKASDAVGIGHATKERTITFPWKPPLGGSREYAMSDPRDQHRVYLSQGVESGHAYPVVVAFHGQPARNVAPRTYRFPALVVDIARELVQATSIDPLVVVTPVFRFEGQNWPGFDVEDFIAELHRILAREGLKVSGIHACGHSGAAGCGGGGLNQIARTKPDSVAFFDTCLGDGFLRTARLLSDRRIRTLILHSVETAGFRPRPAKEYDASFDFGKIYAKIGLSPASCPAQLPDAPLRDQRFRCATNSTHSTTALVLDTGVGEAAHEALVPVGLRYYLKHYVSSDLGLRSTAVKNGRLPSRPSEGPATVQ